MLTRRRLLQGGTLLAGLTAIHGARWLPRAYGRDGKNTKRPRYFIQLLLAGGVDGLLSIDPKTRSELKPDIMLPYKTRDIIDAGGGIRLGPHFHGLKPSTPDIAVVNGVRVFTANHFSGGQLNVRLKADAPRTSPGALEIIGTTRDSQPLAAVSLGAAMDQQYTPGYFGESDFYLGRDRGKSLWEQLTEFDADELQILSDSLAGQSRSARSVGQDAVAEHLSQASAFLARVKDVPPLKVDKKYKEYTIQTMYEQLQRTVWLLKHDLTSGVYVHMSGWDNWDSHVANDAKQERLSKPWCEQFNWFMKELKATSNAGGSLFDQMALTAGSELGRYPYYNDAAGKDHLPQTFCLFAGPWFNKGIAYSPTGKQTEGLPVDIKTGRPQKGGTLVTIDEIGTTLLDLAGVKPELYGYQGTRLDFLMKGRS